MTTRCYVDGEVPMRGASYVKETVLACETAVCTIIYQTRQETGKGCEIELD